MGVFRVFIARLRAVCAPARDPMQNNAEAFGFLLTMPVVFALSIVLYRVRYDTLRFPQRVHNPYLVRTSLQLCTKEVHSCNNPAPCALVCDEFVGEISRCSRARIFWSALTFFLSGTLCAG